MYLSLVVKVPIPDAEILLSQCEASWENYRVRWYSPRELHCTLFTIHAEDLDTELVNSIIDHLDLAMKEAPRSFTLSFRSFHMFGAYKHAIALVASQGPAFEKFGYLSLFVQRKLRAGGIVPHYLPRKLPKPHITVGKLSPDPLGRFLIDQKPTPINPSLRLPVESLSLFGGEGGHSLYSFILPKSKAAVV